MEINECDYDPCHRGNCTDLVGDFQCKCEDFYQVNSNSIPAIKYIIYLMLNYC